MHLTKKTIALLFILTLLALTGCKSVSDGSGGEDPGQDGESYLGIIYTEHPLGVRIVNIYPDSPAQVGGLEGGDIIVAINDTPIRGKFGLGSMIREMTPGDEITVTVLRDGSYRKTLKMKVDKRPRKFK